MSVPDQIDYALGACLPPDEDSRLDALYACGILDTPEEESFNRLTRLAAMLTGAPICLVSLVDAERQWFKSSHGIDLRETHRRLSFCAYALGGDDMMIVPDARLDPRFVSHEFVVGPPYVRFYAGAPLIDADGKRLGTFCVVDTLPRAGLSELERRILTDFAGVVMELIQSRVDQRRKESAESALLAKARQAEEQTRLFQDTLDTISQGLSVFDDRFRLVIANKAFQELYGKPAWLCRPGSRFEDHIRLFLSRKQFAGDAEAMIERLKVLARNPAGSVIFERTVEGRSLEIRTHPLENGGFVTTHTDITEIKRTEQQLRLQEKMKDEFISTVSHELRTPLTSIAGALGLVACGGAGELPPEAANLVAIAESNCDRLIRLVGDVLDIERMALGKFTLSRAPTDLAALIRHSIDTLKPYGDRYGVRFEFQADEATPVQLDIDSDRTAQVLANLLSNAVKFSPEGGVVTVALADTERGARVEVSDTGPGVPVAFRGRIFEKFAQADQSDSRKDGTGLGLNIAKMIVEAHQGEIGYRSDVGTGTTFWFELPRQAGNPS